jgi:nucleoside-diphosphate-sugar epimerase
VSKRVIGVARFSEPGVRDTLDRAGVETIACDMLDPDAVALLPRAENVIYMAGRKFGDTGSEPLTWMANTAIPAYLAPVLRGSRVVAFSTGCVYPLAPDAGAGCSEDVPPAPVGEYAASCLGRERIFEYMAAKHGIPVLIYRLNYAIDLRYGVLTDIARRVHDGLHVDLSVGAVNVIWQGEANNRALLCIEQAAAPAAVLNITGAEKLLVRDLALRFGELLGMPVSFAGTPSGQAYLSDAGRSMKLFGEPRVNVEQMIRWIAAWIENGGTTLDKPTHFSVTDGQFLDPKSKETHQP